MLKQLLKLIKAVCSALAWWPLIFVIKALAVLLGPVVVSLALPFAQHHTETRQPFRQWPKFDWMLITLPRWASPWDNPRDGAKGDMRGWYWLEGYPKFLLWLPIHWRPFWKMWWWLVVRNPANKLSRFYRGVGCNVAECKVKLLAGHDFVRDKVGHAGWQFVFADGPKFHYWGFYQVIEIGWKIRAFVALLLAAVMVFNCLPWWADSLLAIYLYQCFKTDIIVARLGHKIEPRHDGADWSADPQKAWKGVTFRPWMPQRD